MIEFEVKSKKQHISVNIRDRPKTNTVCRLWHVQGLQMVTSSRMTTTRRCSSTTIPTIWVAVVTSPTLTARYRSTSSMCRLAKCSSKSATIRGTPLTSSMPRNWMRRRGCITKMRGTMSRD